MRSSTEGWEVSFHDSVDESWPSPRTESCRWGVLSELGFSRNSTPWDTTRFVANVPVVWEVNVGVLVPSMECLGLTGT